jgi:hypothetical protein
MHATVRQYTGEGTEELFDALEARESEVRELISSVPGFTSYVAFRTPEGGMTVTICQDKDGTDESTRRAAAWVAENLEVRPGTPSITEGDAALQF